MGPAVSTVKASAVDDRSALARRAVAHLALAWAEEVTLVSETHASDQAYAAASAAFTPRDLVDLTIAIAAMNAFNRLGAPFRLPVQAKV